MTRTRLLFSFKDKTTKITVHALEFRFLLLRWQEICFT